MTIRTGRIVALIVTAIAIFLTVLVVSAPRAHAAVRHVEPATHSVRHQHVLYSERVGDHVMYVELNDGSTHRFTPCAYEDSVNCWWDSGSRGNHRGHSFVALGHRGTQVTLMYLERGYALLHDRVVGDGYHDNDGAGE